MSTYLITGATGGIGAAVGDLLHNLGHETVLVARDNSRLAATTARTPGCRTLAVDLADPEGIEAALGRLDGGLDGLDGVVHCAGSVELGPVAEMPARLWVEQLMVNLVGAAELTRLLLPALRAAGGCVVFVNSGAGLRASPGWAAYAAAKHGLRALAEALRAEEPRLRVGTVFPGRTATEMQRKVRAQEGGEYDAGAYINPRTVAEAVVSMLTVPSDAQITDIVLRPSAG